jgi:hypothetical protein
MVYKYFYINTTSLNLYYFFIEYSVDIYFLGNMRKCNFGVQQTQININK